MRSGFSFRNMKKLVKFLEDSVIAVTSKSQMYKRNKLIKFYPRA